MPSRPSAPSPWTAAARVVATMRLKLPPSNADIGWRVEFRTMEVQLTDFENAARGATLHTTPAELSHAPQTIPHPTPGLKWWGVHRIPDPRTAGRGAPRPCLLHLHGPALPYRPRLQGARPLPSRQ